MRANMILMRRFWQHPGHERFFLLEAVLWLAVARFAVAVLPFRYVGRLAARQVGRPRPSLQARATAVQHIRWAVIACASQVPWRAMCFEQGLAAQFMLRRRGARSVLYYGAAPDGEKGLAAHVWVRDGDFDVIGCEIASRFAVLATFPRQQGPSQNR
jgi:Transglutaminase-like superfamily